MNFAATATAAAGTKGRQVTITANGETWTQTQVKATHVIATPLASFPGEYQIKFTASAAAVSKARMTAGVLVTEIAE